MARNTWGITSAIVGGILGLFELFLGYRLVTIFGFVSDFTGFLGSSSPLAWLGVVLGVVYLVVSVGRFVVIYGLIVKLEWARITAVVLHFLSVAAGLPLLFLLIGNRNDLNDLALTFLIGFGFTSTIIFLILLAAVNIFLGIMLLQTSTAVNYQGGGGGMRPTEMARQTFVAAPLPPVAPPFAVQQPPPAPVPTVPERSYAQPAPARVARTEVAGPSAPQIVGWLVERNGPRPGREHRLDNQITIGRDASRCEIVIDDSKVSAEHARIRFEQGRFVIFDMASTNHTYVNNHEVQRHVLQDGDQIMLGPNVKLTFMQANRA